MGALWNAGIAIELLRFSFFFFFSLVAVSEQEQCFLLVYGALKAVILACGFAFLLCGTKCGPVSLFF